MYCYSQGSTRTGVKCATKVNILFVTIMESVLKDLILRWRLK